jgi:hypothetical protein
VQLVWYTYYRIFKFTPMLYETSAEALTRGIGAVTMLGIIYAMGAAWSYRLLMKNVHNYRAMLRTMQPGRILANINPANEASIALFKSVGFGEPIQLTLERQA